MTSPGEGVFEYRTGTVVELRAEVEDGHQFAEWTGDVEGIADVSAASTEITVKGDCYVTANFEETAEEEPQVRGGCLIATVAYGTPLAQEVEVLRRFRDAYLLITPPGRAFVSFYYEASPPVAGFIAEHPSLKPIVRAALVPAVAISTIAVNIDPAEKAAARGLFILVTAALAVWVMRRLRSGPQCM